MVAPLLEVAKRTVTVWLVGLSRLTVKTKSLLPLLPSARATSLIVISGGTVGGPSSLRIVPVLLPCLMVAFFALKISTATTLSGSSASLPISGTTNACVFWPFLNTSLATTA